MKENREKHLYLFGKVQKKCGLLWPDDLCFNAASECGFAQFVFQTPAEHSGESRSVNLREKNDVHRLLMHLFIHSEMVSLAKTFSALHFLIPHASEAAPCTALSTFSPLFTARCAPPPPAGRVGSEFIIQVSRCFVLPPL